MRYLLAILTILLPTTVLAGTYFDQSEMATYTIPDSSGGDTFYVDGVNGSDTYNGLSPTYTSGTTGPFKTIGYAYNKYRPNYAVGGDVIKVKAGIYREEVYLDLSSSQTATLTVSTPLSIGPYGDGEVIIDPSPVVTNWTAYDSNIYMGDWPNASYPPNSVIMNGSFKNYRDKQTLGELTQEGLWYFNSSTRKLYVHTGGVNPSTLDPVIPYNYDSAEQYCIFNPGYNYLRFYGLTLRGAARYGFSDYPGGTGQVVEKCTIKWNVGNGIRIFGEYGVLRKNHVWGNMMRSWPRGRVYAANGGWGQGATLGGYGLAEGNITHDNGGEGMGVYGGTGHVVFQDNIAYDNWSVGLYLDNAAACTFQRNLIYSNNPDYADIVETWQLPAWIIAAGEATITSETNKIKGRMRQEGIMAGDESATNATARSNGFKAINNIIIGARRGFTTYGQATGAGLVNYTIANNTIIMPNISPVYGDFAGMTLYPDTDNTGSVVRNNLIYSYAPSGQTQPLMNFGNSSTMSGVTFDNNLYYSVNGSTPFKSGYYPSETLYNFTGWKAYVPSGYDANSLYADPLFVGTAGNFTSADYAIGATSPAKDAGADLSSTFTTDFLGNTRNTFDIGALEYAAGTLTGRRYHYRSLSYD